MITRGQPRPPGLPRSGFRDMGVGAEWRDNDMKLTACSLDHRRAQPGEYATVRGTTADYVVLVAPVR